MNTYEIWSEGFAATGNSAPATYHGTASGKTFRDACKKYFKGSKSYNAKTNSLWGCRLFDNETAARKSFG